MQVIEWNPFGRQALAANRPAPVSSDMQATLADGLAVPKVGDHAFHLIQKHVDQVVQVDEEAIAVSIFRLAEDTKAVVEGAGATGLAALLDDRLPNCGQTRGGALCGGNIDPGMLGRVMDLGLVHDGRLVRSTPSLVTGRAACHNSPT